MSGKRFVPPDLAVFGNLPVREIAIGPADERMAVHVAGRMLIGRIPVWCVPGYERNMADFSDFVGAFHSAMGEDWPVVLVDLKGRGRSADRTDRTRYVSTLDAHDVSQLAAALCIDSAIFLGEGHGGQVVMALAAQRPTLIAGAILVDAGPLADPHGLVRLRTNLQEFDRVRGEAGFRSTFRRILSADYPGTPKGTLDAMLPRTHYLDDERQVRPLFDPHLARMLEAFEYDDEMIAQWKLFNALASSPLMMMRTQLTDQLSRDLFEEMLRRRRDADGYIIEGQASPALLNSAEDVDPIADFARQIVKRKPRQSTARPGLSSAAP